MKRWINFVRQSKPGESKAISEFIYSVTEETWDKILDICERENIHGKDGGATNSDGYE